MPGSKNRQNVVWKNGVTIIIKTTQWWEIKKKIGPNRKISAKDGGGAKTFG